MHSVVHNKRLLSLYLQQHSKVLPFMWTRNLCLQMLKVQHFSRALQCKNWTRPWRPFHGQLWRMCSSQTEPKRMVSLQRGISSLQGVEFFFFIFQLTFWFTAPTKLSLLPALIYENSDRIWQQYLLLYFSQWTRPWLSTRAMTRTLTAPRKQRQKYTTSILATTSSLLRNMLQKYFSIWSKPRYFFELCSIQLRISLNFNLRSLQLPWNDVRAVIWTWNGIRIWLHNLHDWGASILKQMLFISNWTFLAPAFMFFFPYQVLNWKTSAVYISSDLLTPLPLGENYPPPPHTGWWQEG